MVPIDSEPIEVVTWNVNSIRARLSSAEAYLREQKPGICLLQETKVENAQFPSEVFEDLGYNLAICGEKTYNGVAVFSKFPIDIILTQLPGFSPSEARYLEVFTGGMRIISVYAPNGEAIGSEKYAKKQMFYQALAKHLQDLGQNDERVLIGGDYNIAPQDTDVYDPQKWRERILCSTEERGWFRRLLYQGWTDSWETPYRDPQLLSGFTWWDYRGRGFQDDAGLRIDTFLLSPFAADALLSVTVDRHLRSVERPSDHAPVRITLRANET